VSAKIGRNDPCHCGSGKKYKHCHLRQDEQQRSLTREEPASTPQPTPEQLGAMVEMLRETARRDPWDTKTRELLAELEPALPYLDKAKEIDAAVEELEKHASEFDALVEDDEAYGRMSEELFRSEMFAPFRFTAAEVKEALEAVDAKPGEEMAEGDQFVMGIRAAMLSLAHEKRRRQLSMALATLLPELVAQERYLDGWLVHTCSCMTEDDKNHSNPFLFHMFSFGYDALMKQQRTRRATLLREVGIDPEAFSNLSLDQAQSLLEQRLADPERRARVESMLMDPEEHAEAMKRVEETDRAFFELINSDEGAPLRLRKEDLEPVLPAALNRLERWLAQHPHALENEAGGKQLFEKAVWPAISDMARVIFTPERISGFKSELRKIRDRRMESGARDSAMLMQGVLGTLSEADPANDLYLKQVCLHALRQAVREMGTAEVGNPATPESGKGAE
jgi:hypothetical protein